MIIKDYNKDNLTINDIEKIVTRVKVFLVNNKSEILVASSAGGVQLPGGHVEKDEPIIDALIREIKEETGIKLLKENISEPVYEIRHFKKNDKGSGINAMSNIIYFIAKTNELPKLDSLNLTEREKENNFSLNYINKNDFINHVSLHIHENQIPINISIAKELLVVFEELSDLF